MLSKPFNNVTSFPHYCVKMVDVELVEDEALSVETKTNKDKHVSIIDAGFFSRFFAFFIDYTILMFSSILLLFLLAIIGFIPPGSITRIFWTRTHVYENIPFAALFTSMNNILIHIIYSLYFIFYFVVFESKYVWGTTPGKRLLKLSVVNGEGGKLTFKESIMRNFTKYLLRPPVIGIIFGFIEIFLIMFYSKRTGDFLVNTSIAKDIHRGKYYED